jgi:hypothetical protein
VVGLAVQHARETLRPGGEGLPQPLVAPVRLDHAGPSAVGAGDLIAGPAGFPAMAGGSVSTGAAEPTCASPDANDTLFATGNWFAAYSTNRGLTWTYRNPYTYFPALAGGFCCDQWAVSRNGATFWYLQYSKNTSGNAVRIACSPSVALLRNGTFFPVSWTFNAASFGLTSTHWLDFPDLATTNRYLYATSNVFDQSDHYAGSVLWRMPIADLIAGLPGAPFQYYTSTSGTIRLTHGAQDTMYFGTTYSTSSILVGKWADGSVTRVNPTARTVASFSQPNSSNPGPDGRGWSGRLDARMLGAYFGDGRFRTNKRYGFYWTSDPVGSYTKMHVRGAVFDATTDVLVEQPVIWNPSYAIAYGAPAVNSLGHRGVVFAYGGGTEYPGCAFQLEDDLALATSRFAPGTLGPIQDRFGDYYSNQSGGGFNTSQQFLVTGASRASSATALMPNTRRIMRVAFEDVHIGVAVLAHPKEIDAVVTMTPTDRFGHGGARTPFYRAVAFSSGTYTFTAPTDALHGTTNQRYAFVRWHRKFAPGQTHAAQPDGQTSYAMTTGNATMPTELVAEYAPVWALDVSAPLPGVVLTMSPADRRNRTSSDLPYTAEYVHDSNVTLTVPASTPGFDVFQRWVLDGVPQAAGVRTLTLNDLRAHHTLVASYRDFVAGTVVGIGVGCPGSNGTPAVAVTTTAPGGVQIGATIRYELSSARASTLAFLMLGVSTTTWNGVPLPLDLAVLGAPACFLRHDPLLFFNAATNGSGQAAVPIPWPNDVNLIGSRHFVSFGVVDPSNTLGVVVSGALRVTLGGLR